MPVTFPFTLLGCAVSLGRNWYCKLTALQAAIESGGMSREKALALGTTNVQRLLGLDVDAIDQDLIAVEGGNLMNMEGKVAAVLSPRRGLVELL
jgi:hypothetical protein